MGTDAIKSLGLLAAGAGLGLAAEALLWRGDGGALEVRPEVAPSVIRGDAGRVRSDKIEAVGHAAQGETLPQRTARLEGLAEFFRDSGYRPNAESMQQLSDVLAGISGLKGEDFPQLFGMVESGGKLDEEMAVLVLLRWAGENPKAALVFALERKEFKESERVISALMYQLAKVDMREAKASLSRFAEGSEELRDARRGIVNAMLQKNPKQALEYAREIKDPKAVERVLTEWARTAPLLAAAELDPADSAQRPALEAVGNALLAQDRAAFEAWSASLTDAGARVAVRRLALSSEAMTDPAKAALETAAWLKGDPAAAGSVGEQLPTTIAQRWWWAKAPPASVAEWAAALPAGTARDAAVGEVARLWVEQDALGASGWIDGLPAGAGRDRAVNRLVTAIWKETPADAFVWARTIQDNTLRWPLLRDSITGWAAVDPAAALAAVETLPEDQRGDLREIVSQAQARGK